MREEGKRRCPSAERRQARPCFQHHTFPSAIAGIMDKAGISETSEPARINRTPTTMLTGMGASMHVTTARELIVTLRHLHDHPESLKALLINGEVLRRPHAAEDIAIATMELVGKPQKRKRAFCRFYWGGKPAHIR